MSAEPASPGPRVVAIGASAGGVEALRTIAAGLPRDFPSPLLIVLHIGRHDSILPKLLAAAGPLGATHAVHSEALRPGHFHVAPPDRHLLVEGGRIRLSNGPKEHHARPAVDPLLRSVALEFGARAVGAVLSGWGQDGTTGLKAIKSCGGAALVQDPSDAQHADMPSSALRYVRPERCVPAHAIAAALVELAREPLAAGPPLIPEAVRREHDLFLAKGDPVQNLEAIAKPSPFVCPECKGGLWELLEAHPVRFRCHTGHGYTLASLQHSQAETTDEAMWSAIRALQEEELLLRRMAVAARAEASAQEAVRLGIAADRIGKQAARLRAVVEESPGDRSGERAAQSA
jgi:two-component system, chemotaxis family, protein-glutamate methylesterase/glutaminase